MRMTLRQGDCLSSVWFGYGIDPLLQYLEKRLVGITVHSSPVIGPSLRGEPRRLECVQTRYKLAGYCDDLKPAITSMEEFSLMRGAVSMFEKSSGCELHRDLASKKCKVLLL